MLFGRIVMVLWLITTIFLSILEDDEFLEITWRLLSLVGGGLIAWLLMMACILQVQDQKYIKFLDNYFEELKIFEDLDPNIVILRNCRNLNFSIFFWKCGSVPLLFPI